MSNDDLDPAAATAEFGLPDPSDVLDLDSLLTPDELFLRQRIRDFTDQQIRPEIAEWYDQGIFPRHLPAQLGELGVLGMHLEGYGCPGRSAVEYGLAAMELEAGDSGIRTFVSVQGSLAMTAIHRWGSEDQKEEWLPRIAAGEVIGCFALTEPTAGSDPSSMATFARQDGTGADAGWILDGSKRWIGLASIADVMVVWARTDDGIRGFLVPAGTAGVSAAPIGQKLSMRASVQCDVTFDGVLLGPEALLPGARGLSGPVSSLNEARYGIAWGAMGAARDSYEAALNYAAERQQFGRSLAGYQLTQEKLVNMLLEIQKGTMLAMPLGRLKDAGRLRPEQISLAKLNNVREAIKVAREARTILGGNGITLDYSPLRHAANLESVRTYEGTDEVHTLVLGQHITGLGAFR
jgi:glutaryl-CoA dehydrogenase